jgi:hypothetical protein
LVEERPAPSGQPAPPAEAAVPELGVRRIVEGEPFAEPVTVRAAGAAVQYVMRPPQ